MTALPISATRRGRGPLLVCHPGGPGMHPDYFDAVFDLAGAHEVALLHPRGTGNSPRPSTPDDYTIDAYAHDTVAWIANSATEPTFLLGHSHGGLVAARVAAIRPDLVRGLILLGTPAYGGDRAETEAKALQNARAGEPACAAALARLEAEGDGYPPEPELGRFLAEVIPLWVAPLTGHSLAWQARVAQQPVNRDALRYFGDVVFADLGQVTEDLARVTCPVLAIGGDLDGWAGPSHLALLRRCNPRVLAHTLPDSGHMCHVDAMDRITGLVTDFVQDNEKGNTDT
ncbi:alpha/beta fold hydrolase [Allorhizocola rhizosphaerae]|uniref:alpha/beta fold hydrolase n=1 Tax=Allorhizocola rhizosphaerae TaxID=1872709 RepID=UPI000E3B761A|nr:alpha/beta hydrolase [Allorhizocola rhizosphaerae]